MSKDQLLGFLPLVLVALAIYFFAKRRRRARTAPAFVPERTYTGPFGFFRRHFNGDYSLGRSYWLHTVVLASIMPLAAITLAVAFLKDSPARYGSAAFLVLLGLSILLWVWGIAGTWASANKHVARGGSGFWAGAAKLAIVLGVLSNFGEFSRQAPAYKEHFEVAFGRQPGPETRLQVHADGRSIALSGGINDGTATQLEQALQLAPGVQTVMLHSPGGWINSGVQVAEVIRSRGLNTYAEGTCASACTIAFLAGRERALAPKAKLGFHSARAVGGQGDSHAGDLIQIYRRAGLSEAMIRRIVQTPNEDMWYPTHAELFAEGVLTRHSSGGETAQMATQVRSREALERGMRQVGWVRALEEHLPEEYVRLVDAAWNQLQKGASDIEVMTSTRQQLSKIAPRLLPSASDAMILAYSDVTLQQLEALQKSNPQACVEYAFPSGRLIDFSAWVPSELVQRELQLLEQLIVESDQRNVPKDNPKRMQALLTKVMGTMTEEELESFDQLDEGLPVNPTQGCAASVALFRGFNSLATGDRAWLYRTIYLAAGEEGR